MKVKELLFTYQNEYKRLKQIAQDYYNTHYCGYMGEWVNGSEGEYKELLQTVEDYLDSEV